MSLLKKIEDERVSFNRVDPDILGLEPARNPRRTPWTLKIHSGKIRHY